MNLSPTRLEILKAEMCPVIQLEDLFADVKMNHVRGAVSIRNMGQGSDPSSIGEHQII